MATARRNEGHLDPLERAERSARELLNADDWDEPTPVIHLHNHMPQQSHPELQAPRPAVRDVLAVVRELPPNHRIFFALAALVVGAVLVAGGYIVFR